MCNIVHKRPLIHWDIIVASLFLAGIGLICGFLMTPTIISEPLAGLIGSPNYKAGLIISFIMGLYSIAMYQYSLGLKKLTVKELLYNALVYYPLYALLVIFMTMIF